jgi:hypothetical protein
LLQHCAERQNISTSPTNTSPLAIPPGTTMTGKRANLFGQGRPENPYDERDEPAETPQRATAAQLAARK